MGVTDIKDTDFLTATMRIRAMEKNLMDKERASRLIDARSDDEVVKILTECGYDEMQAVTALELDRVLSAARETLYEMVLSMTPRRELLDVFRVRYDYHNAKTLLKCAAVMEEPDRLLIPAGRIPLRTLKEAFAEQNPVDLPPRFAQAAAEARELLARTGDPQRSDFLIDAVCLEEMLSLAEATESVYLTGYVRLHIDVQNLRAVVRAQRIGKGPDFMRLVLAPGGDLDIHRIALFLTGGGALTDLYAQGALAEAAAAGEVAARGEGSLSDFEKLCDDALLKKAMEARYVSFGEQPLCSYLIQKEAEMTLLRTVITGRLAGVSPEKLRERLRFIYS